MHRGTWWATVHGVTSRWTQLEQLNTSRSTDTNKRVFIAIYVNMDIKKENLSHLDSFLLLKHL